MVKLLQQKTWDTWFCQATILNGLLYWARHQNNKKYPLELYFKL